MSNTPDWILQEQDNDQKIHFAQYDSADHSAIQQFVDFAVERAIAIIPQSLREDGRYLLFDWHAKTATLNIVSTNDDKAIDAPESVQIIISEWQQGGASEEQSADLQFWLRDYLTTSAAFLHFSLIAAYCEGDRQQTRLM